AGQNAFRIAPGGVRRGAAAASVGGIDDVVVYKSRGMHHLYDGPETDHAASGIALRFRGEEQKRWSDAFASAFAQVVGDFRDGFNGGNGIVAELALNRAKIVMQ